jgi:hypothetical protein
MDKNKKSKIIYWERRQPLSFARLPILLSVYLNYISHSRLILTKLIGRFGAIGITEFNEIKIGHEYLVMGITLSKGAL